LRFPFSNINKEIGKVLVREGFLESIKEQNNKGKKSLTAVIRYESRIPVLTDVDVIFQTVSQSLSSRKKNSRNRKKRKEKGGCLNQPGCYDGDGCQ